MAASSSATMFSPPTPRMPISPMPWARAKATASATPAETSSVIRTVRMQSLGRYCVA